MKVNFSNRGYMYKWKKPNLAWYASQQKLIKKGGKMGAAIILKSIYLILRYKLKGWPKKLMQMPGAVNVYMYTKGKYKRVVPFILKKKKRMPFLIYHLVNHANSRPEVSCAMRISAEIFDLMQNKGRLYKFLVNFYLQAFEYRNFIRMRARPNI